MDFPRLRGEICLWVQDSPHLILRLDTGWRDRLAKAEMGRVRRDEEARRDEEIARGRSY